MYISTSGAWVKVPYKPANTDRCVQCNHPFGDHFETFSNGRAGCAVPANLPPKKAQCRCMHPEHHQEYKSEPCSCDGFAFRYRESWKWRQNDSYHTYQNNSGSNSDSINWGAVTRNININQINQSTTTSMKTEAVPFKDGEIIKYRKDTE